MELTETIQIIQMELGIWEKDLKSSTPETRKFLIEHVRYVAFELLKIAKKIRETVPLRLCGSDWRTVDGIHNNLLATGQSLSGFLFSVGLRDRITDKIEAEYGISFSGLGIYPTVIDKADEETVFVLYDPRSFNDRGTNFTLLKNGERFFVNLMEFYINYK